jgi:DNA-binding response OmpR family regulator
MASYNNAADPFGLLPSASARLGLDERNRPLAPQSNIPFRVGLLEDCIEEGDALVHLLQENECVVQTRKSGLAFLDMLKRESFDLLMLDWNVPDMDGFTVLKRIRDTLLLQCPVMMFTSRTGEYDIVQALNGGADDYISKPWRPFELMARVRALVRRGTTRDIRQQEVIADFVLDQSRFAISCKGDEAILTHKEFDLARLLIRNLGNPLSRTHIIDAVWRGDPPDSRTMDAHVSRVRSKLRLTIDQGYRITSIYGYGYRLEQVMQSEHATHD